MKNTLHFIYLILITSSFISCTDNRFSQTSPKKNEVDILRDLRQQKAVADIDGRLLKSLIVVYEKFRTDEEIPEAKRIIENYEIEIKDSSTNYLIYLTGKRTSGDKGTRGGESEIGKDVVYSVDKNTFQITGKAFFK